MIALGEQNCRVANAAAFFDFVCIVIWEVVGR
jgi:hypothetical protein